MNQRINKKYKFTDIKDFASKPSFNDEILIKKDSSYPKISIIAPSFNQARFLENTILSVLNQNYPNLEYIIIDGGSNDGSVEIIKKYQRYITYWVSEKDRGQSHALNKGFERATGDIFGWLNSDDLYLPEIFSYVVKEFLFQKEKKIIFGDYFEINEYNDIIQLNYAFDFNISHFIYEGFHNNAQATFWRKSVHERFGKFDESLTRTMDYDMLLRFGRTEGEYAFHRVSVPLECFRRHESQKTRGFDSTVEKEHRYIALKLNVSHKYNILGKLLRLKYRLRRTYWYFKRGGLIYLLGKIKNKLALKGLPCK